MGSNWLRQRVGLWADDAMTDFLGMKGKQMTTSIHFSSIASELMDNKYNLDWPCTPPTTLLFRHSAAHWQLMCYSVGLNGYTTFLQVSPPWSSLPAPLPCRSQALCTWMHHLVLVCISLLNQPVLGLPPLWYGATLVCGSGDQVAIGSWGHPWEEQVITGNDRCYCLGFA